MDIKEIHCYLQNVSDNCKEDFRFSKLLDIIKELKKIEVEKNNEKLLKEYWCLETVLKIQNDYICAYNLMKERDFYKGWCKLEQSELGIRFLSKHKKINDCYSLNFIDKHIEQYQSLFPYMLFFSTEFLEKEIRCSICDVIIKPRNMCVHVVGEIYRGEMCCRKITDLEVLGIAIVKNPVHKYAVAFPATQKDNDEDNYNYVVLEYLIERLSSPFDEWNYEMTKTRHPHSRYSFLSEISDCPCESGKQYKDCCLKQDGVLRPHILFTFANPPNEKLLKIEYI